MLKNRFMMWCIGAGSDSESASRLWQEVGSRYFEPHRHYHTLDHIEASLAHLDEVGVNHGVEGAIWFHDVIYDPLRSDNEEQSGRYFLESTQQWISPEFAEKVHRLIMLTDPRSAPPEDEDGCLMVDIDLSILGSAPEAYDAYAKAIREEYAHVPDDEFRQGRAAVMRGFLEKPIYHTARFQSLEEAARANIARELQ